MRIIDLGDQDAMKFSSPLELRQHADLCASLARAMPATDTTPLCVGLGQGVRVEIGPGAGKQIRRGERP